MVKDNLLLPHVLNCVIGVNLNWVVVLVNLNAKSATGGEVVWLGKMTKAVVLHGLENIVVVHLFQASTVSGRKALDTGDLGSQGKVCSALDREAPLLLQGVALHLDVDQLLHHLAAVHRLSCRSESSNKSL